MPIAISIALCIGCNTPALTEEQRAVAEVLSLTNRERAKEGLAALRPQENLTRAASDLATNLASCNRFEHQDTYGRGLAERVEAAGFKSWTGLAENIARGQASASRVVTAWLTSPGHRKNIFGPSYTELGVGLAYAADGTPYWVQIFGSR